MLVLYGCINFIILYAGLSVESKGEGIVVSSVEEGRLAHVQGKLMITKVYLGLSEESKLR